MTYLIDSKNDPLTEADISAAPDAEILRFLISDATTKGIEPAKYRVFDIGCGRGMLVSQLRRRGWRAYGADINPDYIKKAGAAAIETDDDLPILSILAGGRTIFGDGFFDAVISDQVVEHVADIDAFAEETSRILRPQGLMFHRFPAKFTPVEVHYRLPLAHWLPEGNLRYSWIRTLTLAGLGRTAVDHKTRRAAANEIYQYSCDRTFYRHRRTIASAFENHGVVIDFALAISKRAENKLRSLGAPQWLSAKLATASPVADAYSTFIHCVGVGFKQ
jgi:SAM-dependent methyltransferase